MDRLGGVNQQHLLEMIKNLKEEIDVDRVMRQEKENVTEAGFKKVNNKLSDAYTNQKRLLERIKALEKEIDEEKAKRVNPRVEDRQWNATGAMTVGEGDYTAWRRDKPYQESGRTGNKTKKGKAAARGMSSSPATNRTPDGNIGHGRERN